MNWKTITSNADIQKINEISAEAPVVIYKHSPSCGTSGMTLNRLERSWDEEQMRGVSTFFVDVIRNREQSMAIAEAYDIWHESPQLLLVYKGKVSFHTSHFGINYNAIVEEVNNLNVFS